MKRIALRVSEQRWLHLSAQLQRLYRRDADGWFVLDHEPDPDGWAIGRVAPLEGKLAEARRDLERSRARLRAYQKPDGSLWAADEIVALSARVAAAEAELQKRASVPPPDAAEVEQLRETVARLRTKARDRARAEATQYVLATMRPLPGFDVPLTLELARHIRTTDGPDGDPVVQVVDPETGVPTGESIEAFSRRPALWKQFGRHLHGDGRSGADLAGDGRAWHHAGAAGGGS